MHVKGIQRGKRERDKEREMKKKEEDESKGGRETHLNKDGCK